MSPIHSAHCATHRYGGGPCDCPAGQLLAAAKRISKNVGYNDECRGYIPPLDAAIAACEAAPPTPEATQQQDHVAGEEREAFIIVAAPEMNEADRVALTKSIRGKYPNLISLDEVDDLKAKIAEVTGQMQLHRARVDSLVEQRDAAQAERQRWEDMHLATIGDRDREIENKMNEMRSRMLAEERAKMWQMRYEGAKKERDIAVLNEAVCHCGEPIGTHAPVNDHDPLEMRRPCPFEGALNTIAKETFEAMEGAGMPEFGHYDRWQNIAVKALARQALATQTPGKGQ